MDKEYVMEVVETIRRQLVSLTPVEVLLSWGMGQFYATVHKDMPALRFSVNGRLFQGDVLIALNGSDYYEVYLQDGTSVECANPEVCFDELGGVIDRAVESGTDKAGYDAFCRQQRSKLFGGV